MIPRAIFYPKNSVNFVIMLTLYMLSVAADDYFQVKLGLVLTEDRKMKFKPLPIK